MSDVNNTVEAFNEKVTRMLNAQRYFLSAIFAINTDNYINNPNFKEAFDQTWDMNQKMAEFFDVAEHVKTLDTIRIEAGAIVDGVPEPAPDILERWMSLEDPRPADATSNPRRIS